MNNSGKKVFQFSEKPEFDQYNILSDTLLANKFLKKTFYEI